MRELIVLEGNEGRDDDGGPGPQQAGELVDRGLAATGGQDGENVTSAGRCGDRTLLPGPQPLEAQARARQIANRA